MQALLRNLSLSPFDLRIRPGWPPRQLCDLLVLSFRLPQVVLFNLHEADGVLIRDSSDSPTFHEHTKELRHIREKKNTL